MFNWIKNLFRKKEEHWCFSAYMVSFDELDNEVPACLKKKEPTKKNAKKEKKGKK